MPKTRTDAFIRTRKLTAEEVAQINFIIKKSACRFIGSGRKDWLYPEKTVTLSWSDLRTTLLPPEVGMFYFGRRAPGWASRCGYAHIVLAIKHYNLVGAINRHMRSRVRMAEFPLINQVKLSRAFSRGVIH